MSLFTGLETLRGQIASITAVVVYRADGQMTVLVTPLIDETEVRANPQLGRPFALEGTAQELDADFVASMAPLAAARKSLLDQINDQAEALKARPLPKPAAGLSSKTSKSPPGNKHAVALDDDDDDDGNDHTDDDNAAAKSDDGTGASEQPGNATTPAAKPEPAAGVAMSVDALFD